MKRNIGQEILDGIDVIKAGGGTPAAMLNPALESNPAACICVAYVMLRYALD